MIKTVHYTFILACFSLLPVNGQVVDTIGKTHYYEHEIFWGNDLNIYNNWVLSRVVGGMSGDGFEPSFDRMEVMPYGIFKLYNKDTLLNYGKISIEESNVPNYGQIISFNQDTINEHVEFASWSTFFRIDNETLDITEYCSDCYRYIFESCESLNDRYYQEKLLIDSLTINRESFLNNLMVNSVYFLNRNTGFATCSDGRILKTTNKGKNWLVNSSLTSEPLRKIVFTGNNTGFAAGNVILKTTDSGQTWVQKYPHYSEFHDIHFINAGKGFAAGSGNVYTTDGGENWYYVDLKIQGLVTDIGFLNDTMGYACGMQGGFSITTDGGQTWNGGSVEASTLNHIFFINTDTGIIARQDNGLMRSTDGGQTWHDLPNSPADVTNIYEIVPGKLAAFGLKRVSNGECGTYDAYLSVSSDNGTTWTADIRFETEFRVSGQPDSLALAGIAGDSTYIILFPAPPVSHPPVLVSNSDLQENSGQMIYPNPARDFLNIRLDGSTGHCEILSMQGQVVLSEAIRESRISINSIPSGMYIVKIKTADKVYSHLVNIIEK